MTMKDSPKERLIEAALGQIAADGISRVRLSRAAAVCGLSSHEAKIYFKTRKQLLLCTLESLEDDFIHAIKECQAKPGSAEHKLQEYIRTCFTQHPFSYRNLAAWLTFRNMSRKHLDYRPICQRGDQVRAEIVQQIIGKWLLEAARPQQACRAISMGLQGIVNHHWQRFMLSPDEFDPFSAIAACKQYLAAALPLPSEPLHGSSLDLNRELSDLLPFWTYQDQELFDLEIQELFKPNWMLAGHVSEVPNSGDYLTFEGFGERAIIIRNKSGNLNAFHNICRHRGSTLLTGTGHCRQSIRCPFHGWRYDFDGNLAFVPGQDGFPNLATQCYSLKPLDLEIWHGFIFIRFVSGRPPVREKLKPLEPHVQEYRLAQLQPYEEPSVYRQDNPDKLAVNWKIFHDIDNEGYHVPIGHPSLQQLYGPSYHDIEVKNIPVSLGHMNQNPASLWSVRNYHNLLTGFDHLSEKRQDLWMYFGFFPNAVFALYPDMMEIYMSLPVTVTQTHIIGRCYALPDERRRTRALRYLNRRINYATTGEDYFYMNSMQEGLRSSAYPQWTLSTKAETGVRAYHHQIQRCLPVAKLRHRPAAGTLAQVNSMLRDDRTAHEQN